jgi:hypothetical protein
LIEAAFRTPLGYLASEPVQTLAAGDEQALARMADGLAAVWAGGRWPVLSSESYLAEYATFQQSGLLARLGLQVSVLAYVRPPVEYVNAAWWQWGAWSGSSLEHFVEMTTRQTRWADQLVGWREVPGVHTVEARLLPGNVLEDLHAPTAPERGPDNYGLSNDLLRAFQTAGDIRQEHSPEIDFAVRRWSGDGRTSVPWVLGYRAVQEILDATRDDAESLTSFMREDDAERLRADARWWSAACYSERSVSPGWRNADTSELLSTVRLLSRALLAADAAYAQLMSETARRDPSG